MSTLVQLDIHDDIAAIRGRVGTAPDTVVVLVAPVGTAALHNPVHLRLLRHHAKVQGKEVALVTRDRKAQGLAREAGLRVFTSVRSAGGSQVSSTQIEATLPPAGAAERVRGFVQALVPWTVLTLVLSSLVAGAVIFLPSARVAVVPASEVVDEALAVTASSALTFANVAELRVPARAIEIKLVASGQAEGTGTRKDPERPATGRIVLTNRTPAPVEVPKGTRVAADNGVEFTTVGPAVVPPVPDGRAEIEVVASQPGPVGNVSTRSISRFSDGSFDGRLEVFNPSPTSGGTTTDGAFVTVDDRASLRQKLLEQMKADGQKQVMVERRQGESVYSETISVRALKETFEEVPPATPGGKPRVELKLEGAARALGFEDKVVQQTIIRHLDRRSGGKYTLAAGDLRTQPLDAYQWNDEEVSFYIGVQTLVVPKVDKAALQAAIAGRSVEDAQTVLARLVPLAGRPTVELWPFWASRIPRFPWRIDVALTGVDR